MSRLESLINDIVNESPDRPAVQHRNRRITYGELSKMLDALNDAFGFLAGKRILLLLPDGIPSYLCHLHFFLRGATVAPVSIQSTTSKIKALCERIQPHFVVTNAPLRARHKSAIESYPSIIIKSDESDATGGYDYESIGLKLPFPDSPSTEKITTDVRLIVFTSGSTGDPKGVCLSESNLLAAAGMMVEFLSLNPSRKSMVTVPLYDYYGFIQIYGHILGKCGYIFGETISLPDQLFRRIVDENVTDLALVPHTLREMLKRIHASSINAIRNLNYMTSSSDILTSDIMVQAFELNPDLKIINIYGLTEAGRACYKETTKTSIVANAVGRASVGVEITLDKIEGELGEIIIRGPNVMLGYLDEIIEDRIIYKPCTEIHTGDLAYYDKNGDIILVGRRDHMINIRGIKIHPAEIETLALQSPGIIDAVARTAANDEGDLSITLDVVFGDDSCDMEVLRNHLRKNLPPHFFPRAINSVSQIKRTELGSKIVRR